MEQSPEDYLNKNVRPILEALAEAVVCDLPNDVIGFMHDWLLTFSGQKQNHQINMEKQELDELRKEYKKYLKKYQSTGDKEMLVESHSEHSDNEDDDQVEELVSINAKRGGEARGRSSVSAEVYGKYYKKEDFVPKVIVKSKEQKTRLLSIAHKSFILSSLDEKDLNTVLDAMEEKPFFAGEVVITEGERGDLLYVVEKGELECFKKGIFLKTYYEGESFGELALLYNAPRAASIKAKTDSVLWALDRLTFNHIVKDAAIKKREQYETFLKTIELLNNINGYELSQICDAVKTRYYNSGDRIIRESDDGDDFFIVVEGTAYAEKTIAGKVQKVKDYTTGDYFGELALIKNEPRAASVIASSKCTLISLDRKSFKRLLGPIENILKRSADSYVKYINK